MKEPEYDDEKEKNTTLEDCKFTIFIQANGKST